MSHDKEQGSEPWQPERLAPQIKPNAYHCLRYSHIVVDRS